MRMEIIGSIINWLYPSRKHRRRVISNIDRFAYAALLDAALKNSETLFMIINKYGELELHEDDETETKTQALITEMYKKAAVSVLDDHKQELTRHIDTLIDFILGTGDSGSTRCEEVTSDCTYADSISPVHHRRLGEQKSMHIPNLSVILRDLITLAMLFNLANQGIQMKGRGESNKTDVVEFKGQEPEADANKYHTY